MNGSARQPTSWFLAVALVLIPIAGISPGCSGEDGSEEANASASMEDVDPEALFAEAEKLRVLYEKDASLRAIGAYREARAAWTRGGESVRAATASHNLGTTEQQLGLLSEALRDHLDAAARCRESCDPLLQSAILSDVGSVQAMLAHDEASLTAALQQCERALSLARRSGGLPEEADALTCAAEVEYHRGTLDEALQLYRQASPIRESVAGPRGLAEALYNEGTVLSDLSQFGEARADLEEALSLWTSSRDYRGEAMAFIALGRLEHRRGEYQDALNHFRQAVDRLESVGDLVWQASALSGIGGVYFDLGDGDRAREYMEQALERFRKTGLVTATWDLLLGVGRVYLQLQDPSRALARFQESLELAEKTSDRWKQAYSLQFMGAAHREVGEPEASLKCLERAIVLQQAARDARLEASIRMEMGNTHEMVGEHARAAESFDRALELSSASHNRIGEAAALFGMARVAEQRNDLDAARDYVERSLDVIESLRTEVDSRELRASYFASIYQFHELYIDVLMRLHATRPREGFAAAAFEASERVRARSLLESLIESEVDIRAGVEPELLEREASLKRRLEAGVERRLRSQRSAESEDREALDAEIRDLEARRDRVLAEIRSKSPRYSALTQPKPLGLSDVQDQLLDDDTLLLEYSLGKERSFLWAVSKGGLASFELSPRDQIEGDVERLYELSTARARVVGESLSGRNRRLEEADAAYAEASAHLSETLLGPVADLMAGRKIVIVADGALQRIPFAGLPVPGSETEVTPLIVSHEIVSLPSASTLAVLRHQTAGRKRPRGTVAVFADPVFTSDDPRLDSRENATSEENETPRSSDVAGVDGDMSDLGLLRSASLRVPRLEATRQEAAAILMMAPKGTTFRAVGFDASRAAVMSAELGKYRIIHFATHGISSDDSPTMSGVVLSMFDRDGRAQDGFLQLNDIYDLRLSADLVVLSACSTALGKQVRGEGTVGIVRAFLYAGAERVVATLWKVDDEATRELMTHFYREMLEERRSPSTALRNAQLAMWRDTEWRSPFYWAAFLLQGEWRAD